MAEKLIHHYFVDEAGCLTLFDKRGRIIVGEQGASKVFMVGVAHIPDPDRVDETLDTLRSTLLNDPYFAGVPSMQPEMKKTALHFHAKDDLPEVRREVFRLLPQFGAKVQVFIRRKHAMAQEARSSFRLARQKASADALYDDLVKRLFRNMLHKADENRIVFSRRGKAARYEALQSAIARAKANFDRKWGIHPDTTTTIESAYPSEHGGLQVVDYYLWAVQRLYERSEDRFFSMLADAYRLIVDLDDKRHKPYGEYYSDSNPLELQKIEPVAG
ncbi:MAG: DUF3800 domain-containing protein [Planctomycetota bacterium]|nr:DUF3800 domain-containing protein [Planctomycetota bacterium]